MSRHVPQVTNRYGPDVSVDLRSLRVWLVFALASVAYGVLSLACVLIAIHGYELSVADIGRPSPFVEVVTKFSTVVILLFLVIFTVGWRVRLMTRGKIGPEDQIVTFQSTLLLIPWLCVLFAIFAGLLFQRSWLTDNMVPINVSLWTLSPVFCVGIWAWDPIRRLLLLASQRSRQTGRG